MGITYTMADISRMTGLHKNTIRNYIKRGTLKAELVKGGNGVQTWVVQEDVLYHSGIQNIISHLGTQTVPQDTPKDSRYSVPDIFVDRLTKLSETLLSTNRELDTLRFEQKALMASAEETAQEKAALIDERDRLAEEKVVVVEERAALSAKAEVLEVALEQARANARWGYRRQMKKAGK